jgi:hypothetical protein
MKTTLERSAKQMATYYGADIVGEILTRNQAAAYLKLCQNKVDILPIPKVHIGRSVRYRKSDIDAWLAKEVSKEAV